jgi:hypothetical protein
MLTNFIPLFKVTLPVGARNIGGSSGADAIKKFTPRLGIPY